MKENIIDKIKLLTDIKMQSQIYKVFPSLMNIKSDDLKNNIQTLKNIGIVVKHIYEVKICLLDPKELNARVQYIKNQNQVEEYVKNPLLIMDSSRFTEVVYNESLAEDEPDEFPIMEDDPLPIDHLSKIFSDEGMDIKVDDPEPEPIAKEIKPSEESELDSIIKNSDLALGAEHFDRYYHLSEIVNDVIKNISSPDLIYEAEVYNNLSKLVVANYEDDYNCLFTALTYKKDYPEELKNEIKSLLEERLNKEKGAE